MTLRIGAACAGIGGLERAVQAAVGGDVVWHAENNPNAAAVLAHHYPDVPNHDDMTTIDWHKVEPVEILTAGFPCTDISAAGKQLGMGGDTRSGVWAHVVRAIAAQRELATRANRPGPVVVIENVRALLSTDAQRTVDAAAADSDLEPGPAGLGDGPDGSVLRALGAVCGDLASIGFDAEWTLLAASEVGACHRRDRVFLVAWPRESDGYGFGDRWPTVSSAAHRGDVLRHAQSGGVALLPTPAARDWKTGTSNILERNSRPLNEILVNRVPTLDQLRASEFGPALAHWERVSEVPAPEPTEPNTRSGIRHSARFVEWMQGLPVGYVTDHIGRDAALERLGNAVMWQQGAAALRLLWRRLAAESTN